MSLLIWRGPTNGLILTPESPRLQYTDRVRATDIYMGVQAVAAANMLPRGTLGAGFRDGWVVNQCSMETMKGGIGKLTIEWEAGGAHANQPLPIGDVKLTPNPQYPKVERNTYFQGTSGRSGAPTTPIAYDTIRLAYQAFYNAEQTGINPANVAGTALTGDQLLHFNKLKDKLMKGEETFYIAAWQYSYEVFSYTMPTPSKGGYVETPGGPYAAILPGNVGAWLRLSDDVAPAGVNGSMYKTTISYLGGVTYGGDAWWDPDLYNGA